MTSLADLKIKLFADSADVSILQAWNNVSYIHGFTTNPTLMRQSGVKDYKNFAREVLTFIQDKPISFEVFSDDFEEMYREACTIAAWGDNVFVKIPVTNTRGESSASLIKRLVKAHVKLNVTAVMTQNQVKEVIDSLQESAAGMISIFAGRIADTGRDPLPIMCETLQMMREMAPQLALIWASPREILNIFQANDIGCHVITLTNDLLKKLSVIGKDLELFSLETVKMFYDDAQKSGFNLMLNDIPTKKIPA